MRILNLTSNVFFGCLTTSMMKIQIWDFNLGRSRDHKESYALETAYGTNNEGFTIKSYTDLLEENSFAAMKVLEDKGDPSCPCLNDDILSSNVRHIQSQTVSLLVAVHLSAQFLPQYIQ